MTSLSIYTWKVFNLVSYGLPKYITICFDCGDHTSILYIHYLNAWSFYRTLLLNNYGFLQDVNVVPPLVAVGIFAATLSASLSTLIGASRVLIALARDKLFGKLHLLSER